MIQTLVSLFLIGNALVSPLPSGEAQVLTTRSLNLENRQPDPWVNKAFADNIVLTLRYMSDPSFQRPLNQEDFKKVRESFEISFTLKPGQTFAFQDDVLSQFKDKVVGTTNSRFNLEQGFRSSGWLMGDGVCHLASFINMAAKETGLEVVAYVNHNFAPIPDIPREFGTSIFYMPGNAFGNAQQNLYITNNLDGEVIFTFKIEPKTIKLIIVK